MNIIERYKAPTPKFFKFLRTVGIALATAGGAFIAAPIALPVALVSLAGYVTVAGSVMVAVSQAAVEDSAKIQEPK